MGLGRGGKYFVAAPVREEELFGCFKAKAGQHAACKYRPIQNDIADLLDVAPDQCRHHLLVDGGNQSNIANVFFENEYVAQPCTLGCHGTSQRQCMNCMSADSPWRPCSIFDCSDSDYTSLSGCRDKEFPVEVWEPNVP